MFWLPTSDCILYRSRESGYNKGVVLMMFGQMIFVEAVRQRWWWEGWSPLAGERRESPLWEISAGVDCRDSQLTASERLRASRDVSSCKATQTMTTNNHQVTKPSTRARQPFQRLGFTLVGNLSSSRASWVRAFSLNCYQCWAICSEGKKYNPIKYE